MTPCDVKVGMILLQIVVGVLANSFLLDHNLLLHCMKYRLRTIDTALKHLILVNFLTLLCRGVDKVLFARFPQ
jgi:hypothetical protein